MPMFNSAHTPSPIAPSKLFAAVRPAIAVNAAKICRKLEETVPGTDVRYEYSPESYTGTEIEYAVEICDAVAGGAVATALATALV